MNAVINDAIERLSRKAQSLLKNPTSPVVSVSAAVVATYLLWRVTLTRRRTNTPPIVPYNIPFIGNGLELTKDPQKFIAKCKRKYGPVFQM
jgi:hypothetical protein